MTPTQRNALELAVARLQRADEISGYPNNKALIKTLQAALGEHQLDDTGVVETETRSLVEPAKREWVGLTKDEVWGLWNSHLERPFPDFFVDFRRAYEVIECELKRRNS